VNWYSTVFFVAVLILTVIFALHDWVKRAQDNYAIDSMLTMPPRDFWLFYGENYSELARQNDAINFTLANSCDADTKNGSGTAEITKALNNAKREVRIGLDQIIRLAKKWDSANLDNANITYRANIMRAYYFKSDDDKIMLKKNTPEYDKISDYAERFITHPPDHNYSGFVALEGVEYTTTTKTTEPEPDHERKSIAFPFTLNNDSRDGIVKYNFPGASQAVATKTPSYVPNVKELPEQYKIQKNVNNLRFEQRVYDNLVTYYADNKEAKSILSIPLVDNSHQIRYVLNVYRDQSDLLYAGGKVLDFTEIVRPYAAVIESMLFTIDTYENP
jgi:hypothetical protein